MAETLSLCLNPGTESSPQVPGSRPHGSFQPQFSAEKDATYRSVHRIFLWMRSLHDNCGFWGGSLLPTLFALDPFRAWLRAQPGPTQARPRPHTGADLHFEPLGQTSSPAPMTCGPSCVALVSFPPLLGSGAGYGVPFYVQVLISPSLPSGSPGTANCYQLMLSCVPCLQAEPSWRRHKGPRGVGCTDLPPAAPHPAS